MTFPCASLKGLDPVAVCAPNYTLVTLNLSFDRFDRFESVNMRSFTFHMVNIQRGVVRFISTVNATRLNLEVRKPLFDSLAVFVSGQIDSFSITGLLKTFLSPFTALLSRGLRTLRASAARAQTGAIFCAVSFGKKDGFTLYTSPLFGGRIFPGRHTSMIAARHDLNPCKPKIFAATYDEVHDD